MADSRERWFIDDFELTQGAVRDVELREGLYGRAELVGDNGQVPNRSGEVWRPKKLGANAFAVNIWTAGADRTALERLHADILQAVGDGSRLPIWRRHLANGTVRETKAEVVSTLAPTPVGQTAMRLSLEARAPSGVWEATVDAQSQTPLRPGSGYELVMSEFGNDVTAPMERLVYRINGPATGAKVIDSTTTADGESFTYVATIPTGGVLTVNSETWAITGTGMSVDRGAFYHTGSRFLTVRVPRPRGFPKVRFEYSSGGAGTRLTVTGRPAYAV